MTRKPVSDLIKTLCILGIATAIGLLFMRLGLSQVNIIPVYILGVLLISAASSLWYSMAASLFSVLLFNYIFTEPMFSLKTRDTGMQLTLFITFLATLLAGCCTNRTWEAARRSRQDARRSRVILDTVELLQRENSPQALLDVTASQLNKLLKRDVSCCLLEEEAAGKPRLFTQATRAGLPRGPAPDTLEELAAARRCLRDKIPTGSSTETLPSVSFWYLPAAGGASVYGVIGIRLGSDRLDEFEASLTMALISQCAITMEKDAFLRQRQEEAAAARAEKLRSDLLRSISHDLRTPLTGISGSADILLQDEGALPPQKRRELYQSIRDDSHWLIRLVENLLSITRMEGGGTLKEEPELLEEVIEEACRHLSSRRSSHSIELRQDDGCLLVPMDAQLIMQVITNVVNNAIFYTQEGSHILIHSFRRRETAVIEISDDGPGIPPEARERVFELFYTTGSRSQDGRRGLGLGLALCRTIMEAHGGTITAEDNPSGRGALFRLTLPAKENVSHESMFYFNH